MSTADKYVAAAYVVFLAAVLAYVVIIAAKLARLERDLAEVTELARGRSTRTTAEPEQVQVG